MTAVGGRKNLRQVVIVKEGRGETGEIFDR